MAEPEPKSGGSGEEIQDVLPCHGTSDGSLFCLEVQCFSCMNMNLSVHMYEYVSKFMVCILYEYELQCFSSAHPCFALIKKKGKLGRNAQQD